MASSSNWKRYADAYDPVSVASIDGSDKTPHDKGVIRALESTYHPNRRLPGIPEHTLFVCRLHPKVTNKELEALFEDFGKVIKCTVVCDIVTGTSRQYGFVEFEKRYHAERAHRHAHKKILRGAEILVDWEAGRTMKGWKPRSLGGGFGGRKESGQLRFGCRDRPWDKPIILSK